MADVIEIEVDSPKLGEYNPDGSIARYPTFDIMGQPFNQSRPNATRRVGEGGKYFVVLPVAFTRSDVAIVIKGELKKAVKPYVDSPANG